jgi:hypothetical protein
MAKIKTRLFHCAQDQIQGKSWFSSVKRKTAFLVQLFKIVEIKPKFWMGGFLNMLFSIIYDTPYIKLHLHVLSFFGFSGQKFVHPHFPPFLISRVKQVPQ